MNKADKLKQKKQEADEQVEKFAVELERLTNLKDPENSGNLAHYNVEAGKVAIFGADNKQEAILSEENFKRLLEWGNKLFAE